MKQKRNRTGHVPRCSLGIQAVLVVCLILGGASAAEVFINVGEEEGPGEFGFGWGAFERDRERSFAWIRYHREADVWIHLEEGYEAEVEIDAAAYYSPSRRQALALYVNDRFIAEWEFQHRQEWVFELFKAVIPDGVLIPGRNRLTLRVGYTAWKGYAVAVRSIKLAPRDLPEDKANSKPIVVSSERR